MSFDETAIVSRDPQAELIAVHDALTDLAIHYPRKSRIVELRFFGGLSIEGDG